MNEGMMRASLGWQECKLGDLVLKIVDNRGKNPPYAGGGYEVIETACISGKEKYPNFSIVKKYVDEKTYLNWFRSGHPKKGDLLIITVGNGIGSVSIMPSDRGVITQNLIGLRFKSNCNSDFFYYFFNQEPTQEFLRGLDIGSAQPSLKVPHILNLEVPLPSREEQTAIARALSSLDDKIDLLQRQNKTLEAMAEALFQQWFVAGAREGWENGTIADLIEFNPPRKLSKGSVAPYLEMASLSNATFHPDGWYEREFSSGTKFINGDTLLARITPCLENGKTAFVTFLKDGQVCWGSTEYIVMRPKIGLHPFFAYTLARNSDFRDYAEGCLEGSSGRQRVNVDHLKSYEFKIPKKSVISDFNSIAESIVKKLHSSFLAIRTVEKLRDTILPKLMSGEVRVMQ